MNIQNKRLNFPLNYKCSGWFCCRYIGSMFGATFAGLLLQSAGIIYLYLLLPEVLI